MMPRSVNFWMSAILPESMNSFMSILCLHGVAELADAFHVHRHRVAGGDRTDALWSAGRNDVAWLEGHDERDEFYEVLDRENQMGGTRGLPALAVHPRLDRARVAVQSGGDARADRRERIEPFAARVLRFFFLKVARCHVVHARQPADELPGPRARHSMRAAADDDADLRLVIDAADARRQANRIARTDHRGQRLDEEQQIDG